MRFWAFFSKIGFWYFRENRSTGSWNRATPSSVDNTQVSSIYFPQTAPSKSQPNNSPDKRVGINEICDERDQRRWSRWSRWCFQESSEHKFFKAVSAKIVLGCDTCSNFLCPQKKFDPIRTFLRELEGVPWAQCFPKNRDIFHFEIYWENIEDLLVATKAAVLWAEIFLRNDKNRPGFATRISCGITISFVPLVARWSRWSRRKWRWSRSEKQKLRFREKFFISQVDWMLKYATVAFIFC